MLTRRQLLLTAAGWAPGRPRPNIVLFVADDLGYGELGCQGNPQIPTPHIDSLAGRGLRFTQGYVTAPFCAPSRAGLITGRYQTRFGHELNVVGTKNLDERVGLPLSETTLATRLQRAGYATACVGKWHLGTQEKYHPLRRGFDEFYGFLHEGHYYVPPPYNGVASHLRPKEPPYDANNPLLRGTQPIAEPEYLTDAFAREAAAFVGRQREKPFFLYVPWNAIHSPMQTLPSMEAKFAHLDEHRRVFAGMLTSLDNGVGRILAALRESGAERNTLVIFLSDNGGPTAELTSSNLPLRGGKGQLYEGGIRIPFLLQWLDRVKQPAVVDDPVISTDIVPTVLTAAGIRYSATEFDGVDLLAAKRPRERTFFWRYGKSLALRQGKWKLVRQGREGFQLFDLSKDTAEAHDRRETEPARAKAMERTLEQWNQQMSPPLWTSVGRKRRESPMA